MSIKTSVSFTFRTPEEDIFLDKIIEHFSFLTKESDSLLRQRDEWFETGHSKSKALENIAFKNNEVSKGTLIKWKGKFKKDARLFIENIWNGKDNFASSIS